MLYRRRDAKKQILSGVLLTLPVEWLVASLVFSLIHIVPGDPILQMLGEGATPADVGALLAGAIVTEKIFGWPGLGRLEVDAISNRNDALVQGCLLAIGLTYVLVNLLTDVVYRWVNPRMRS